MILKIRWNSTVSSVKKSRLAPQRMESLSICGPEAARAAAASCSEMGSCPTNTLIGRLDMSELRRQLSWRRLRNQNASSKVTQNGNEQTTEDKSGKGKGERHSRLLFNKRSKRALPSHGDILLYRPPSFPRSVAAEGESGNLGCWVRLSFGCLCLLLI